MFTRKDVKWFSAAAILVIAGCLCIAFDPQPGGLGPLTLWIAPPLLLSGFAAVVPGIAGGVLRIPAVRREDVAGIGVFVLSLFVYLTTMEPTASLWDCSEFIASAYKLQVPHTPGNPLLLLLGRIASMFALGDPSVVAKCINAMSSVFAAATVWLIYTLISFYSKRLFPGAGTLTLMASAIGGSLCLAFSDTLWFSAVEAETYATSVFFMFLILKLIIAGAKYEGERRDRMAILIFYLAGLGYCIHPMCLLVLPVFPIAWGLINKPLSIKAIALAAVSGMAIVLAINRIVAVGLVEAAFATERLLVNGLSMPFYSGAIVFTGMLIIAAYFALRIQKARTITWSLIFLIGGFSPYAMLFLRSAQNPPIDESNPENLPLAKAYMNREGYPTRPLIFGPYFDAEITDVKQGTTVYFKDTTGYRIAGTIPEYIFEKGRQTLFPRLYSNDAAHIAAYRDWTGLEENQRPGFIHNLLFMVRYQVGQMYLRYLMFNFAGRESDVQNSAWLKPWEPLDPETMYPNRARNQYWMVPLLFGIAGAFVQVRRRTHDGLVTWMMFLGAGILLALYINSTPAEPRERDYIYVGSFVVFSIWIGLGITALAMKFPPRFTTPFATAMLLIPMWMFVQNIDDHNRSGRTFQADQARNILASCEPNAILFTGGDNDTFSLWYVQEVENFRTDVHVVVLSYLNTDWYINQLRREYYDSEPFRLSLNENAYRQYGPNDALYIQEKISGVDAPRFLGLLNDGHRALRVELAGGDYVNTLPSRKIIIPSPVEKKPAVLSAEGRYLQKNALAIVDIAVNNPDRPVYFNFTSMQQTGLSIDEFLVQEGHLFRLDFDRGSRVAIDTEKSFRNLVESSSYENLLDSSVYFNHEDYELRMVYPLRQMFNGLTHALMNEGKLDQANATANAAMKYFYNRAFQPSIANLQLSQMLIGLGRKQEAEKLASDLYAFNDERIRRGDFGEAEVQMRAFAAELLSELADSNPMPEEDQ